MKGSKKHLFSAISFLVAALLFIPAAAAQTEMVPKVLFIIVALLEMIASGGFFWDYLRRK